ASTGVSIVTDPMVAASGQAGSASECRAICASEHPARPSAADGETRMPAGSVTTALSSSGVPSALGFSLWGTETATFMPAGAPARVESGCTLIVGFQTSLSQPVTPVADSAL